ncbi:MAG: lipopolysaccharide heptosyltransferase II, partial [Candidatus Binataceae bacterium]
MNEFDAKTNGAIAMATPSDGTRADLSSAPLTSTTPGGKLGFIAGSVLVKEVNWLGDLVISLPALRAIRFVFSTATLAVLVKKELAGFFDGMEWIDEVMPYTVARGVRGAADRIKVIHEIHARHFNLAILFPNSFESALWATLAGVPRRAGYLTDHRGAMLTHRAAPPPDALAGHQSGYWLAMVRETLGVHPVVGAEHHQLEVGERHRDKMRAWLSANRQQPGGHLIAIAPAAAYGPAKEWPAVRYSALVDLLGDHMGVECVLVGAPSERLICQQVAATSKYGALVAAGVTSIGELMALLEQCDGFAGNDSGAMHLAAALGIPAVGIFGSTNPARTGPIGPH